ncbi:DUF1740-domain-containing protein [Didymella exigua CBS 183.55]|uniref:DUF1740-domain-containing protein n=1 Tax=Didymella exigua CBS 183.55 TaxID=1150837 RepID=A0A6A5R4X3_9PLEO|nr:DUF1740-domain-containing protein [Didymella exigua CBS 183.55]KAF1922683.1 DUF1740-domain-containing protein [Didymella exigua CBS 183.55]
MSSGVPRFASFRPQAKPPEQPPPEEPRRDEKRRKPWTERRRGEGKSPPRGHGEHHRDDSSKKPYFSDRRGDLDIGRYQTLNRYDVPAYRRTGHGNVLGLPDQKIDRESSTDKSIWLTPLVRPRQKRMLTDKHAAREGRRTLRLIKTAESHQTDAARDFIALSSTRNKSRKQSPGHDSDEGANAAPDVDYRGIDEKRDADKVEPGKVEPGKVDDPDTYYESDTEAANAHSQVTQRNSRLIRETRADPSNLQAWLDLIEHQEAMMKLDRAISELSAADQRNLADVRISTYEEALRRIGNDGPSQIELQVGLLREARRHWDAAKVAARWREVLGKHPRSVELWFAHLDFVQSTFSRFKYDDCRAAFLQALHALQSTDSADAAPTPSRLHLPLHLFVRLTALIQEAGYQELALAAWQAVLEYNLLAPQHPTADKTQRFEEFWESEAPRIGESGSKGWRHTLIDDAVPPPCSIILEGAGGPVTTTEDFRRREKEYMTKLRYPGRSTDHVAEDDPFHTIFFSDLRDVVANVPSAPADMQIDAFLCFCGLPPLAALDTTRPWWEDPYLQSSRIDTKCSAEPDSETPRFSEALSKYSQSPITSFQMTSDLLVRQTFSLESSRLDPGFVRSVLRLLATNMPDSEFVGEYLLAFESKHFPSDVAKSAKRLLKANPTSVRLYNMYGLVENHLGNTAKAEQVFAAALDIKSSPADRLRLLSSYVWQALRMGNNAEALRRLLLCSDPPPAAKPQPESASIESARSALQMSLETALLNHDLPRAILSTALLSLLAYLTAPLNTSSALQVHTNLTAWLTSHRLGTSPHAEQHAQTLTHLLAHHATHTPVVKPSLIRDALAPLLAAFPSNTILLSTYAANESRFAIDDRVRGTMHRALNLTRASSAATWAFALRHEALKGAVAGSTSHSVRSLFQRATRLDAAGAHCAALWDMYVAFEMALLRRETEAQSRMARSARRDAASASEARVRAQADRVRQVAYAGLAVLPWSKEFVVRAFFADTAALFGADEAARLHGVMAEKELRLYVELDESWS